MRFGREYLDAVAAIVRRDWLTFISYRAQFFSQVGSLFMSLALFHFVSKLVRVSSFPSPADYFAYVVIGMLILQTLQSTLIVSASIRSELVAGTFERMLLSPLGGVAAMMGMMVFPFASATVTSALTLALAALVFDLNVTWSTAPLAIPVALLSTGTFAGFGLLFACLTLVFKRALSGAGLLITGIGLVSGLYFPVALLPSGVRWLADVQPFTPSVDLLRHLLVGTDISHPTIALIKVAGFAVVLVPAGMFALTVALRYAQRRGTIIEY